MSNKNLKLDFKGISFTPTQSPRSPGLPVTSPVLTSGNSAPKSPNSHQFPVYVKSDVLNTSTTCGLKSTLNTQSSSFVCRNFSVTEKSQKIANEALKSLIDIHSVMPPGSAIYYTIPSLFHEMKLKNPVPLKEPKFCQNKHGIDRISIKCIEISTSAVRVAKIFKTFRNEENEAKLRNFKHPNVPSIIDISTYSDKRVSIESSTIIIRNFFPNAQQVSNVRINSQTLSKILVSGISVIYFAQIEGISGIFINEETTLLVGDLKPNVIFTSIGVYSLFNIEAPNPWNQLGKMLQNLRKDLEVSEEICVVIDMLVNYKDQSSTDIFSNPSVLSLVLENSKNLQIDTNEAKEALIESIDNGIIYRMHLRLSNVLRLAKLKNLEIPELEMFMNVITGDPLGSIKSQLGRSHQYLSLLIAGSPLSIKLQKYQERDLLTPQSLIIVSFHDLLHKLIETENLLKSL